MDYLPADFVEVSSSTLFVKPDILADWVWYFLLRHVLIQFVCHIFLITKSRKRCVVEVCGCDNYPVIASVFRVENWIDFCSFSFTGPIVGRTVLAIWDQNFDFFWVGFWLLFLQFWPLSRLQSSMAEHLFTCNRQHCYCRFLVSSFYVTWWCFSGTWLPWFRVPKLQFLLLKVPSLCRVLWLYNSLIYSH